MEKSYGAKAAASPRSSHSDQYSLVLQYRRNNKMSHALSGPGPATVVWYFTESRVVQMGRLINQASCRFWEVWASFSLWIFNRPPRGQGVSVFPENCM